MTVLVQKTVYTRVAYPVAHPESVVAYPVAHPHKLQSSSVSKFYKNCKSLRYRRSGGRTELSEHQNTGNFTENPNFILPGLGLVIFEEFRFGAKPPTGSLPGNLPGNLPGSHPGNLPLNLQANHTYIAISCGSVISR